MRSQLSRLYNQLLIPLKSYTIKLIKSINRKTEDDNYPDNPFIIF
jgi:hypothetical protein